MKLNQIFLSIAMLFAVCFLGCSSDDDNGGDTPTDGVTFEISGEVEGEKSGFANVVQVEESGITQIFISMNDGITGVQTFSLILYLSNTGQDAEIPSVGEYSIGTPAVGDFWVVYTDIGNGDSVEYGSIWGASGTLTITGSTPNRLTGQFEFTAEGNVDSMGVPTGSIEVTNGQFSAQVQ
nr:hypothetical protein [Saprospiraceae bacterium]